MFRWRSPMRKLAYWLLLVALLCETKTSGRVMLASPAPAGGRATLSGNVPPWANASNFKGSPSDTDWVGIRVYLNWQNADQLAVLAAAVSDPASRSYGQYLKPA